MIQRPLRFGALFAGYGGLEDGVQSVIGGVLAWYSEHEPPSEKNPRPSQAAARIMEYHHPGVPNLGDITQIDWHKAATVDVLTGGSPCFAAGTPVLTRRGLIPIEGVDVGDHVWTHEARWRPVTATMVRDAPTVEFRPGFYSTPDHRFWLRTPGRVWNNSRRAYDRTLGEPEWIPAELSQGHYAATPARVTGVRHDKPSSLTWWQIGRFLAECRSRLPMSPGSTSTSVRGRTGRLSPLSRWRCQSRNAANSSPGTGQETDTPSGNAPCAPRRYPPA